MNKLYFTIGIILTSIISYFAALWISIFSIYQKNREEAVDKFYENVPNLIQNTIDITLFCVVLGLIALVCFYLSYIKSTNLLKRINLFFLLFSSVITMWYIWTLL